MGLLFVSCSIDIVYSMVNGNFPFYTSLMKPVVVLLFLNTLRANLKVVLLDLKDSLIVLLIIFSFIVVCVYHLFFVKDVEAHIISILGFKSVYFLIC